MLTTEYNKNKVEEIESNNFENQVALKIKQQVIKGCKRKDKFDKVIKYIFLSIALIAIVLVFLIVIYLLISGIKPFVKTYTVKDENGNTLTGNLTFFEFITGNRWNTSEFSYHVGWLILNTLYLTILSILISAPISVFTALFITRIAPKPLGDILNVFITILAGIPSVIIGVFSMGVILPIVSSFASLFNQSTAGGRSVLAAILVLAIMSLPTITSMSVTAIKAVDNKLIMSSLALGASKTQTNFKVVLTSASSGIFSSIILGMGRAIGEASAIQMVTGSISGPSFALFSNTSTLTTIMLMGMGEAVPGSLNYDARFAAGLILMFIILITNIGLNCFRQHLYNKQHGTQKKKNNFFINIKSYICSLFKKGEKYEEK